MKKTANPKTDERCSILWNHFDALTCSHTDQKVNHTTQSARQLLRQFHSSATYCAFFHFSLVENMLLGVNSETVVEFLKGDMLKRIDTFRIHAERWVRERENGKSFATQQCCHQNLIKEFSCAACMSILHNVYSRNLFSSPWRCQEQAPCVCKSIILHLVWVVETKKKTTEKSEWIERIQVRTWRKWRENERTNSDIHNGTFAKTVYILD